MSIHDFDPKDQLSVIRDSNAILTSLINDNAWPAGIEASQRICELFAMGMIVFIESYAREIGNSEPIDVLWREFVIQFEAAQNF